MLGLKMYTFGPNLDWLDDAGGAATAAATMLAE
jgi:hypothetical protein